MADIKYMAYKLVNYSLETDDQVIVLLLWLKGHKSEALHHNLNHLDITQHSNRGIRHRYRLVACAPTKNSSFLKIKKLFKHFSHTAALASYITKIK